MTSPYTKLFLSSLLVLSCALTSSAQVESSAYEERLEGVVVTAGRLPSFLGKSARIVTVLDSLAISSIPATTVNDLLKFAVGVDVRQRGAEGVQTDISIRGGTCEQIAVLLDGVSISDPQTGHNSADFPVPFSEIERIEILEGPAARTYGTSSLLGAINIVTRKAERTGLEARIEGGSFGLASASMSLRKAGKVVDNSLSAAYSRSDGYSRNLSGGLNMDFRTVKAFYKGNASLGDFLLGWNAGLSVKDFGSGTFYSPRFDDQFEHTAKTFLSLQGESSGRLHIRPRLYWNHSEDRFELFRSRADLYPFNYHRTDVLGLNIDGWFSSPLGKTAFGAEIRNEGIISTNLGEPLDQEKKVKGKDAYYKVGLNRTDMSIFLEHNITLSRFSLSGGASISRNTGNDEGLRVYPGLDLSYSLSDKLRLYSSFNSSLRMPSFTELYYSVGGYKADKNLKAEKMRSLEGGFKFLSRGLRIVGGVYYLDGRDLIDWIRDLGEEDAPWMSVNHARIRTVGGEITVRMEPGVLLDNPSFPLKSFSASYAHNTQKKEKQDNVQSYYSLEYLRNKVVLQADVLLFRRLSLNLSYRWHDRVGSYEKFVGGKSSGEVLPYKPYSLVDGKLSWDGGKWNVYLEADNIFSVRYFDHGNIPQPGAWVKVGTIIRL